MEINLTKTRIQRIRDNLRSMYDSKAYAAENIAKGCYDSTGESLRIIKLDAQIEATRSILQAIGINAYCEDGNVILWNTAEDCEIKDE